MQITYVSEKGTERSFKLMDKIKQDTKEPDENKKEDGSTTVSELFGATETNVDPSNKDESTIDAIFLEAPFSGLLSGIPVDMGIEDKNLYAFKKQTR